VEVEWGSSRIRFAKVEAIWCGVVFERTEPRFSFALHSTNESYKSAPLTNPRLSKRPSTTINASLTVSPMLH
jgi:hypothetical protein